MVSWVSHVDKDSFDPLDDWFEVVGKWLAVWSIGFC
jgi:hypothetical protein